MLFAVPNPCLAALGQCASLPGAQGATRFVVCANKVVQPNTTVTTIEERRCIFIEVVYGVFKLEVQPLNSFSLQRSEMFIDTTLIQRSRSVRSETRHRSFRRPAIALLRSFGLKRDNQAIN